MKNIIAENFHRASMTYGQDDGVQKKSAWALAKQLREVCPNLKPEMILDIGCGTGNAIQAMYNFFPNATYHINDISVGMLDETSRRFQNQIDFCKIHGDIEHISFACHYDLIISNLCLQWVNDLAGVLGKILKHTKVMAFSCLLEDSFKDWYDLLEQHDIMHASRAYPSQTEIHHLIGILNAKVLHASQENHTMAFSTAMDVAKYLKNLGANTPKSISLDATKVSYFLKTHHKTCSLQYNIGFFIIAGHI